MKLFSYGVDVKFNQSASVKAHMSTPELIAIIEPSITIPTAKQLMAVVLKCLK